MKSLLVLAVLATSAVFAAANNEPSAAKQKVTPKPVWETNAYKKRFGGILIQPGTMNGCVALFGAAGSEAETETVARSVKSIYRINAKSVKPSETPSIANAGKLIDAAGATVGVFVVDSSDYPTLMVAPESKWAFVNVGKLKADSPDAAKLAWRTRKEIWRAFAYVCGGGASGLEGCVMNPLYSLGDLDALKNDMISPEGLSGMNLCFKKLGITPYRRVSYRDACREGWAPAPTNEFEKVIWEKVKAENSKEPTKGLKIKYDPKKGR